jgi:hypothetical protein
MQQLQDIDPEYFNKPGVLEALKSGYVNWDANNPMSQSPSFFEQNADAFNVGFQGLGLLGSLPSLFQQFDTNRFNMEEAKRDSRRKTQEYARQNQQRQAWGDGLAMAANNKNKTI